MHAFGTARRIVARRAGGPEVLQTEEVDVAAPGPGEVLISVTAAGVNPADFKQFANPADAGPVYPGFEVVGTIAALGDGAVLGSGGGAVGDRVVAFRVRGGYTTLLRTAASGVFAAPAALDDPAAANLLLAGTTAADLLDAGRVAEGDVVLLHGASGAVGVSVLQQALPGVRVIGTAGTGRFDEVRRFGGEPVRYGDGLEGRVRALAPGGVDVAFDCVGTEEAAQVSVDLVADRDRILTVAAPALAARYGFRVRGGDNSRAFRDRIRGSIVDLAAAGRLEVPVARTYPLEQAREALEFLAEGHPGGKIALLP